MVHNYCGKHHFLNHYGSNIIHCEYQRFRQIGYVIRRL
jgi:hypothetical protein